MQAGGEEWVLARGQGGDAGERDIDSVEERVFLVGGFHARSVAMIGHIEDSGERDAGAAVLGFLLAQAFSRELDVGAAEHGVIGAFGDAEGGGGHGIDPFAGDVVVEAHRRPLAGGVVVHALGADGEGGHAGVDLERRPGEEAGLDLIGKDVGVSRGLEDFLGHFSRDLVLAVAVGDASDKDGGEDQGTIEADGADDIVEDAIVSPDGEGLVEGLGKAEVGDAGEVLIDAVAAVGGQQLLGADQGQLIP